MKPLRLFLLLLFALPCSAQSIFNCGSGGFSSGSGTCGASSSNNTVGANNFKLNGNHGSVVSGNMQLAPSSTSHSSLSAVYATKVNLQAFTSIYTFVPSGNIIAFAFQNTTNQTGFQGLSFAAGAGCEGGIFQAKNVGVGSQSPNLTFGILMDGYNNLDPNVFGPGPNGFTYSNTQVVQATQDPCSPNDSDPNYWASSRLSTSPVALNSPSNTPNTSTGHVYSVTVNYDGTNLNECMIDVTAANGTCNGTGTGGTGTFYQKTWTAINIPAIVGANTAFVMITGSTISAGNVAPVQVNSWSYTVNTPSVAGVTSMYTSAGGSGLNATFATAPTFSPVAGSYGGSQSVSITCSGASTICYALSASTITAGNASAPQPDNEGNCATGTKYTGAITISTSQTLYAMCGLTYTGLPSNLVSGVYTIGAGTLALTATHLTMEQGQPVPPLIYSASGPMAPCTGAPNITTTATSGSTPGTYPISISAGTLSCTGFTLAFTGGSMVVIASDGKGAQINNSVTYPSGFFGGATNPVLNVKSNSVCNLAGDGVTDDTACINTLLSQYEVTNCATQPSQVTYLYFPPGVYLTTGQINPCGNGWTFFGSGPQSSYFRLKPNSAAFNTGTATQWFNPSSVNSASNFREYVYNMGFDVGYGNPNAIPVTALMNNSGALRNVIIWAEDSNCPEGLNLSRAYAGPALAKNLAIYGCADAIYSNQSEYNFIFDQLTTEGQTAQVIDSTGYNWSIQHWLSDNSVTAYLGRSVGTAASIAVLDSELLNGSGANIAIRQLNTGGIVYERGVTMTGYGTAISDANGSVTQTTMPAEYWTGTAQCLFCSTAHSLGLPEAETPSPTDDPVQSNWTNLGTAGSGFCAAITGSTSVTVYSPPGTVTGTGTYSCTIPDTVNHLIFYNGLTASQNPKFTLTVAGTSATPLVIDGCLYAVCEIVHTGSRTVVVKDSYLNSYQPSNGAGNVFFEDDVLNGGNITTSPEFWPSQSVWARQLNIENKTQTNQYVCNGAKMWLLGYKTENDATVSGGNPSSVLQNHCQAEIFGHFYYPLVATGTGFSTTLVNSSLWDTGITFVPGANQGWPNLYQETQLSSTLTSPSVSQSTTQYTNAYYSYGANPSSSGLLATNRAINWGNAGACGGGASIGCTGTTLPARSTICQTLGTAGQSPSFAQPTTAANIVSALQACAGTNQAVLLNPGTYTMTATLFGAGVPTPSNVTLRGSGPLQSTLKWTNVSNNCSGIGGAGFCVYNGDSGSISSAGNIVPWTSGYTAGTTSITLGTATTGNLSNLKVGSLMVLAQCDQGFSGTNCASGSATDNGNWWNCGVVAVCTWGGSSAVFLHAGQAQIVTVKTISGNTVTFSPAIYAPNWSSGLSPFVWFSSTLPVTGFGIENLTMDTQSLGSIASMANFLWTTNSWISNVRMDNNAVAASSARLHAVIQSSAHVTVRDSYMYGGSPSSDDYGIDFQWGTSDSLAENNISQHITTGFILEGAGEGNVLSYNYAVDDFFGGGWQIADTFTHDEGDAYNLVEGQEGIGYEQDNAHATSDMLTAFRNYWSGYDPVTQCPGGGLACYTYPGCGGSPCPTPPKNQHTFAVELQATNRYTNFVYNVIGGAVNDTNYQNQGASGSPSSCPGYPDLTLYSLNFANSNQVPYSPACVGSSFTLDNDPLVSASLMRWGNYDAFNTAVLDCTAASTPIAACTANERGNGASTYPALASPSTSYSSYPSLYLVSEPPFWGLQPWPAVGPDITGGNIANAGGHAYHNPAALCYLSTLGGKTDGSSGILPFDATPGNSGACYYTAPPPSTCGNPFQNVPNSGTYTCTGSSCSYSGGGTYTLPITIGFTSPTAGCAMHMTLDGSTPNCSSTPYAQQSLSGAGSVEMLVVACQGGFTTSAQEGGTWIVNASVPAAPTINLTVGPGVKF